MYQKKGRYKLRCGMEAVIVRISPRHARGWNLQGAIVMREPHQNVMVIHQWNIYGASSSADQDYDIIKETA